MAETLKEQVERLTDENLELKEKLQACEYDLLTTKDAIIGLNAQAVVQIGAKREAQRLAREYVAKNTALKKQLKRTISSTSWKVGKALTAPVRKLKRLVKGK